MWTDTAYRNIRESVLRSPFKASGVIVPRHLGFNRAEKTVTVTIDGQTWASHTS